VSDQAQPAAPDIIGFRPLKPPSSPFVMALLAGIVIVAMLAIAGGGLFVLAVGVVLAVFLRPIVDAWASSSSSPAGSWIR
jgi:hypothetical protein